MSIQCFVVCGSVRRQDFSSSSKSYVPKRASKTRIAICSDFGIFGSALLLAIWTCLQTKLPAAGRLTCTCREFVPITNQSGWFEDESPIIQLLHSGQACVRGLSSSIPIELTNNGIYCILTFDTATGLLLFLYLSHRP